MRGELPDEEEKEKYSVDFLRKGTLGDEAEEMERERRGDFKYDERENFGTAEVPCVIDRGTSEEKPKSGVGWGLGKSTGLSLEQKQLIRYESHYFRSFENRTREFVVPLGCSEHTF